MATATARYAGTIIRLNRERGFGFISSLDDGQDLFFHRSACDGCAFELLREKQSVTFEIGDSLKGARAERVRISNGND